MTMTTATVVTTTNLDKEQFEVDGEFVVVLESEVTAELEVAVEFKVVELEVMQHVVIEVQDLAEAMVAIAGWHTTLPLAMVILMRVEYTICLPAPRELHPAFIICSVTERGFNIRTSTTSLANKYYLNGFPVFILHIVHA